MKNYVIEWGREAPIPGTVARKAEVFFLPISMK